MIHDDVQNSSRLIKLYKHLPEENLKEFNLLITVENIFGYTTRRKDSVLDFKNQIEQLSDEQIFEILSEEGTSGSKTLLNGIAKQMHVYLALRENVIDENIQWLI